MQESNSVWTIINKEDGNDTFTVEAETYEEAALIALNELGWAVCIPDKDKDNKNETI